MNRLVLLSLMVLFLQLACASETKMKKNKFAWNPTVSAPENFPVRLLKFNSKLVDGTEVSLQPQALIANGWGQIGAVQVADNDYRALPDNVFVEWFSYVEGKSFGGTISIDQKKLETILKDKPIHPVDGQAGDYSYFIVGLAPQGFVTVWLSGNGITKVVAQATVPEVQVDKEMLGTYDTAESYRKDIIEKNLDKGQVQMEGITPEYLNEWQEEFRKGIPIE